MPISERDVQNVVAGAVSGLAPNDVQVVLSALPERAADGSNAFVTFGPFVLSRASLGTFKVVLFSAVTLNLVLLGFVLFFWTEIRRLRSTQTPALGTEQDKHDEAET
jgi:hypothetical protein